MADLNLDLLVFFEGAEARTLDLRVVDKNIRGTIFGGDEAEPLLRVEPLHSSLWHFSIFPFLQGAVHRVSAHPARCHRHTSRSRRNVTRPLTSQEPRVATSILRKFDTNTEATTANSQPCSSPRRQTCIAAGFWGGMGWRVSAPPCPPSRSPVPRRASIRSATWRSWRPAAVGPIVGRSGPNPTLLRPLPAVSSSRRGHTRLGPPNSPTPAVMSWSAPAP